MKNAILFSQIFLNPPAVMLTAVLSCMGATNCFSKASLKSVLTSQEALEKPSVAPMRRVRIVYRGLGRAFVVHKNRDLEENNFFAALGLVC